MRPAYISDDGRVFNTEKECIAHERFLANKGEVIRDMVMEFLDCKRNNPRFLVTACKKTVLPSDIDLQERVKLELTNDSRRIETLLHLLPVFADACGSITSDSASLEARQLAYELIILVEAWQEAYQSLESIELLERVRNVFIGRCLFVGLERQSYLEAIEPIILPPDDDHLRLTPKRYEYCWHQEAVDGFEDENEV